MTRAFTTTAAAALATVLFVAATPVEARQEGIDQVRAQLVGNWELIRYVSIPAEGDPVPMNYVGRIMYDAHGNMSAIGMPRDLPERPRGDGGEAPRGGFAYFAKYDLDVESGRVTHNVHGSPTNVNWVNTGLVRYYDFADGLLTLSIRNAAGRTTGALTWRRLD